MLALNAMIALLSLGFRENWSLLALIALQSVRSMHTLRAMAALTIRKLDEDVKTRLRVRAARNGRSMEEEARVILAEVLDEPRETPGRRLVEAFRQTFGPENGVDLDLPSRETGRPLPDFSNWPDS